MLDGQFELDGYKFGHPDDPCVVLTDGWDHGKYEIRDQDKLMPFTDTRMFGRDYRTPGTWTFTIGVRDPAGGTVYEHLTDLARAWGAESKRLVPGEVSTLKYRRNGETRIAYGRPREFIIEPDGVWDNHWKLVTCTFQLSDPYTYGGTLNELTLDLVNTSTSTGLVFPTGFPWVFERTTNVREGVVNITTGMPTPFRLVIRGPITGSARDFSIQSSTGWQMKFPTYLTDRGNIVVDTMMGTAKRNGRAFGAASALTSYRARLEPGPQEISFRVDDPSYTATATLQWRDVSPII